MTSVQGRILVIVVALAVTVYMAFRHTPELDGVKNATLYRLSVLVIMLRGFCFVAFEVFRLFPLR